MQLLPSDLRVVLPPIGSQANQAEPIIYAHFLVPDSPYHWYVAEGSPIADDFVFFGFHIGSEHEEDWNWRKFRLSDLEAFGDRKGIVVVREPEFKAGRFTDVVPHPYLGRDFSG